MGKNSIRIAVFTFLVLLTILVCIYNAQYTRKPTVTLSGSRFVPNLQRTVLFWDPFFSDRRWSLPADTVVLQCPLAQCKFTNQRDYLASVQMYDVIIFHTARDETFINSMPLIRDTQQLYVFSQLESPKNTIRHLNLEHDFYNLTMTYRLDSDVVWSYNHILDMETNATIAPAPNPQWRKVNSEWTQNDVNLMNMIKNKHKKVAWFVSNCVTNSKREKLMLRLKDYIEIDVFGACGKLQCAPLNKECDDLLDKNYKFYLSFENSLCTDYVTEKLFKALERNVIPVVFGGANYTRFVPPQSYIDTQAFSNVSALAAYLLYLDQNPLEYARYFWWRRQYKVNVGASNLPFCDLCHYINSNSVHNRYQVYRDIEAYWRQDTCSETARIDFLN